MADGRDLDNYSAQTQAATTKYQSTGRTSTLSGSTIGSSVNGYSQSANLAKPCVFDFNLKTNVCPTCQGTGRVPKAHDEELVAIIPYKDKRLKRPKRYCCYFSMCLLLLMVGGAVSAGLLFPRTVTVKQYKYSSGFWILSNVSSFGSTFGEAEDSRITMQVKVHIHMRNNNYVGVTLNRLNVLVLHDLILVGSVNTTSALMLPPLSDMENIANVTCIFTGKEALRVKELCSSKSFENNLFFTFQVSSVYTNIAQTFETDYTTRADLLCNLANNTILSYT